MWTLTARWAGSGTPVNGARLVRYSAVSVVSTTTSLLTLGVLVGLAATPAVWANVVATAVGTVPSFELNRRWVWRAGGRRSVLRQVVPFCALSATGLVVSTVAVGVSLGPDPGVGPLGAHRRRARGQRGRLRLAVGGAVRGTRPGAVPVPSRAGGSEPTGAAPHDVSVGDGVRGRRRRPADAGSRWPWWVVTGPTGPDGPDRPDRG